MLALDADYELSPELASRDSAFESGRDDQRLRSEFRYRIFGRPLRASVYPPHIVLFRRIAATYYDEGHTQRHCGSRAEVEKLPGKIYHDDRKPLSHWLQAQDRYATIEAKHLLQMAKGEEESGKGGERATGPQTTGRQDRGADEGAKGEGGSKRLSEAVWLYEQEANAQRPTSNAEYQRTNLRQGYGWQAEDGGQSEQLSFQDRLRLKIFFAAPAMFLYLMFGRGSILDGWPGWFYVAQRTIAEFFLSVRLLIEREKLEFRDGS